ncbi:MAG: hypothetical protein A2Y15_04415 [Clostridiales bacterium GWF2_36_10]|nr:MAG: hypothetical protein A2Y15_04415 [Clostridiales bacterium GWF2_36_10]HAN20655.1 hypothetical protein [Clostridiales bacterium]
MIWRRLICLFFAIIICFTSFELSIEPATTTSEYNFSENIVYGGKAVDVGDYIYYVNTDDNNHLYRRIAGSNKSELVYSSPVGYLNLLNDRIYFISENKITSINYIGKDKKVLYNSNYELTHLYVAVDCFYFLCKNEILKYKNGNTKPVFSAEGMIAFLPINKYQFKWYSNNPEYIEIDQTSDEIYEEAKERFIEHTYSLYTNSITQPLVVGSYNSSGVSYDYKGPYVEINDITLPLAEYMPGSFFSKNGQACTCHNDHSVDCIASLDNCNCMRYWPTGKKETCEVDLLGAQCFAFARFVFYKSFGFIDHSYYNPGKFNSVGALAPGVITEKSVKELMMKAKTGAHVRLTRGHSVSVLTVDEDFIIIYHGNSGGDGITYQPCIVSTRRFTWAEFAAYAVSGISYVNMPTVYPDDVTVTPKVNITGYYKLKDNLNVRTQPVVSDNIVGLLSAGSFVNVIEVDGVWGRIEYGGSADRWICLDYTSFYTLSSITPGQNSPVFLDNNSGYFISKSDRLNFTDFTDGFSNQNLYAYDKNGNKLSENNYISTGSVLKIEVNGTAVDTKTIIVRGDANGNGVIDAGDYLISKRIFLGSFTTDNIYRIAADANADSVVNSKDYLVLKRYLIGVQIIEILN